MSAKEFLDAHGNREELRKLIYSSELFVGPEDVAPLMGVNPHAIRTQAKQDLSSLGFPAAYLGTRLHIPRIPFLRFIGIDI